MTLRRILLQAALLIGVVTQRAFALEPVKIGFPANLTGPMSPFERPMLNGAQVAALEINAAHGVLGGPLELVVYDAKTDPTVTSTIASRMIYSDKVVGIIGFVDSDSVLAMGPQIQKARIPMITPGATSPKLPAQVGDQIFLSAFGDNVQAAAGAEFVLTAWHAKTAYLMTDSSTEYTNLLADYFVAAFEHGGGKLLGKANYRSGDKNFSAQIARIKSLSKPPAFIYCASNTDEAGLIIKQLRQAGVKLPVVGGDGLDSPLLAEVAGQAANDIYFTTHTFLGEGSSADVRAFMTSYEKFTGHFPENAFAALGYTAVRLMADAITRAGSIEPGRIAAALAATSGFQGITGTITYRPGEHIPSKSVTIVNIQRQKSKKVGEIMPSFVPEP